MKRFVFIDTNVLLCLVDFYEGFSYLVRELKSSFDFLQFCVPDICVEEAKKVLLRRNLSELQAEQEILRVKDLLKYEVVKRQSSDNKEAHFLLERYQTQGLHFPDNVIVAMAKRSKAWKVYTTDNALFRILVAEGLGAKKFPSKDTLIDLKLRKKY